MTILAGVDGCPFGWLCITRNQNNGVFKSLTFKSARELFNQTPLPTIFAIDIPIGLTDSGTRKCDVLARKMLGLRRGTSVFPAPVRPALKARNRNEANEINRSIDGRGVNVFSWGLYPKIIEIDNMLVHQKTFRKKVFEVHPELSFMALNNWNPILEAKRGPVGESIRRVLVNGYFGPTAFDTIRQQQTVKNVHNDDINDAFAALWTSERIYNGKAKVVPEDIEVDSKGLPMGIWH